MNYKEFYSRIARSSDYSSIVRLCRRAVGPEDYVLHSLKETIADGNLFLAFSRDVLVGMTNFTRTIDGCGWLGMARTDPDWRGRGVARFLQRSTAEYARRKSIETLRLLILSTNYPSLAAAEKGGFRRVAHTAHLTFSKIKSAKIGEQSSSSSSHEQTPDSIITKSRYIRKMNGYLAYAWYFVRPDARLLESLAKSREIISADDVIAIFPRARRRYQRTHSEFSIISGPTRSALEITKQEGSAMKLDSIGTFLPFDRHILDAARLAGFQRDQWAKHSILFEKPILDG
jgi:GNAT superfamily N-acetyltransferase